MGLIDMDKPDYCPHSNVVKLYGKTSDSNYWVLPSGAEGEGYVPGFLEGCKGGDYIDLKICADCGVLLNFNKEAVAEYESSAKRKKVLDCWFDDFKTADEVADETGVALDEVEELAKEFVNDGYMRYVTTDDCQVFDEGAMTGEYLYDETEYYEG